jgi:hypothetical protein
MLCPYTDSVALLWIIVGANLVFALARSYQVPWHHQEAS